MSLSMSIALSFILKINARIMVVKFDYYSMQKIRKMNRWNYLL